MRRIALISLAAVSLAACSAESTAPSASDEQVNEFAASAFGNALTSAGGYDPDLYEARLTNAFPDEIKLTDEQRAKIRTLVEAFKVATKADRDALNLILRQAMEAVRAGKSRAEVIAILDKGLVIRDRLRAAETTLKTQIEAILTAEQRAWLAAHTPQRCDPSKFVPLTDAQKAQMRALEAAFQEANKADLAAVKAAFEQVKAGLAAGKTREELKSILDSVLPAIQRLEAARRALHQQLQAVLTPEQKASRCLPLG
ncbi:MAG TPA: Spy/CpxP family protein refolding chaperone [Gemmatimonadaceae bacterium]|nr:Spy/CpxP family protein refolding chaperone [Gemmatimonadaceae bacterium]